MTLLNSLIPSLQRSPVVQPAANFSVADLGDTVKPRYDVVENDDAFALVVDLPGVEKSALEITAEADVIRIVGKRSATRPDGWTTLYRETSDASFLLELTHDNAIDLDKVQAELRDGVLRATLPKSEAIKPRKITVA